MAISIKKIYKKSSRKNSHLLHTVNTHTYTVYRMFINVHNLWKVYNPHLTLDSPNVIAVNKKTPKALKSLYCNPY